MVKLAVRWRVGMGCDSCEIDRGGTSYTVETVREIVSRFNLSRRPAVIIGDDLLAGFGSWREAERLAEEAEIVVFHRLHEERLAFPYPHTYLDNRLVKVSSTVIRERVRMEQGIRHLVPLPVSRYIARHHLYAQRSGGGSTE
jgi:nicotinate-nucleotide adenylyltransferase